jgi:hypothetical protein
MLEILACPTLAHIELFYGTCTGFIAKARLVSFRVTMVPEGQSRVIILSAFWSGPFTVFMIKIKIKSTAHVCCMLFRLGLNTIPIEHQMSTGSTTDLICKSRTQLGLNAYACYLSS